MHKKCSNGVLQKLKQLKQDNYNFRTISKDCFICFQDEFLRFAFSSGVVTKMELPGVGFWFINVH